jgi:hypothetical protein
LLSSHDFPLQGCLGFAPLPGYLLMFPTGLILPQILCEA